MTSPFPELRYIIRPRLRARDDMTEVTGCYSLNVAQAVKHSSCKRRSATLAITVAIRSNCVIVSLQPAHGRPLPDSNAERAVVGTGNPPSRILSCVFSIRLFGGACITLWLSITDLA